MRYEISETVVSRTLQGEEVLLNLDSGVYFGLDPVGTRFWNELKKTDSLESVEESLSNDFSVSKEVIRKDLDAFLKNLEENDLIRIKS